MSIVLKKSSAWLTMRTTVFLFMIGVPAWAYRRSAAVHPASEWTSPSKRISAIRFQNHTILLRPVNCSGFVEVVCSAVVLPDGLHMCRVTLGRGRAGTMRRRRRHETS